MSAINTGKVIAGGLLAGFVLNVLDMITGWLVLMEDFRANATRLGLDPAAIESGAAMAVWITIDFLLGILIVWTYAAIRPRCGPGPKTAVYAALIPFVGIALIMFGLTHGGMMTMALWTKVTAISLVSWMLAAVAGAWAYSE
jgi:hypothetical protein